MSPVHTQEQRNKQSAQTWGNNLGRHLRVVPAIWTNKEDLTNIKEGGKKGKSEHRRDGTNVKQKAVELN